MHEYDVALKRILTRPGSVLLKALTGSSSLRWLNVEMPLVRNLRADLLGQFRNRARDLLQLELQSRNEKGLPVRMGQYYFSIGVLRRIFPLQIVLYVGEKPMRMKNRIETPNCTFSFHLVDVRDLDGELLLASPNLGDNVIAILTRLGSQAGTVRRILERIAAGEPGEREEALTELSILAGLRRLTGEVKREARKMPILEDIMENEIFGPAIRQGRAEGLLEGRVEGQAAGRVEGRIEGQAALLLRQMEKRFGRISRDIHKRIAALKPIQLERAGLRLLDAKRIDDVFSR